MRRYLGSFVLLLAAIVLLTTFTLPAFGKTVYVDGDDGNDSNPGTSWPLAKQTIQAGLNAAESSDQVWVENDRYCEHITLKAGVELYGGFFGNETELSQRDWLSNKTILDGEKTGRAVISPQGATGTTRIDGFHIWRGRDNNKGGGIYCDNSSPTIANNTIYECDGSYYGGGISCYNSSPMITGNTIKENSAVGFSGGGIYLYNSSPTVSNNVITDNDATHGGGLYCSQYSNPIISNNQISGNLGQIGGGAIECQSNSTAIIANNMIVGNNSGYGGSGIECHAASPMILNNTIVGNNEPRNRGVIYCDSSSPTITNNIMAFNSSGINILGSSSPILGFNCVYNPDSYNYQGIIDPTGINGNISQDPTFANTKYRNLHIQSNSPCVGTGSNSYVYGSLDIDDQARIQPVGGIVDMGADESDGTVWPSDQYTIIYVKSDGNDAKNGSSWALAKGSVQDGIDAASATGGEVWVKAGTYGYGNPTSLYRNVYVYGGFAGNETQLSQRNWLSNVTILDGHWGGSVISAKRLGYKISAIDGFTIQHGKVDPSYGGGIYCWYASPIITNNNIIDSGQGSIGGGIYCQSSCPVIINNRIIGNSTSYAGGGISCSNSSPTIADNIIAGNSSSSAGGIYFRNSSNGTIINNTITGNSASYNGGAIYCENTDSPAFANNIMAFNSSGIYKVSGSGNPTFSHNCVYNPGSYNYQGVTDPTGTDGNISFDPLFVNKTGGDYHLTLASPCVNVGWNDAPGLPATDMDGQNRILGGVVDIGADEYPLSAFLTTIHGAKKLAENSSVEVYAEVVTAKFSDVFYIENDDEFSGIRVQKSGHTLDRPMKAHVFGKVKTNTEGEVYIEASVAEQKGSETGAVDPVSLPNRAVGGGLFGLQAGIAEASGLNNIGLLITTWGKVTEKEPVTVPTWFKMEDGSVDGTTKATVKVTVPSGVTVPDVTDFVVVTGISSCYLDGSDLRRLLRMRDGADIQYP